MLPITIRAADAKDAPEVASLLNQLGYSPKLNALKTRLMHSITTHDEIYVALLDKKVVALLSLVFFDYLPSIERYGRITTLVVEQSLQGWGMGKTLIEYAKARATAQHCTVLELTTGLQRTQAHGFYEHLGFQQVSYKYTLRLVP